MKESCQREARRHPQGARMPRAAYMRPYTMRPYTREAYTNEGRDRSRPPRSSVSGLRHEPPIPARRRSEPPTEREAPEPLPVPLARSAASPFVAIPLLCLPHMANGAAWFLSLTGHRPGTDVVHSRLQHRSRKLPHTKRCLHRTDFREGRTCLEPSDPRLRPGRFGPKSFPRPATRLIIGLPAFRPLSEQHFLAPGNMPRKAFPEWSGLPTFKVRVSSEFPRFPRACAASDQFAFRFDKAKLRPKSESRK